MIPVLPESAPFTPAQRAWLNGFFAGLLGMDAAPAGPSAPPGLDLPRASVAASAPDTTEEEFPWHDPTLAMEERLQLAAGRPFERVLMASMAQLDCGSCGYMCQTYAEAIAGGEETDLTKCVPGGSETAKKLKELVVGGGVGSRGSSVGQPEPMMQVQRPTPNAQRLTPAYDRKNPFPAGIVEVGRLNRPGSAKDVRHVALDLGGSGLTYGVGDALGVYPENCPELVEGMLTALGATGEEPVADGNGRRVSAREALAHGCVINRCGEKLLSFLAGWAGDPGDTGRLRALLAEDEAERFLEGQDLLDLLEAFPSARGPVAELVDALPALQPRLYSIASSPRLYSEQVHVTVGVVRYSKGGCPRVRKGVASTFLAERVRIGQQVTVFVQPSHGFRLPAEGDTPIIMVGPGTGIAPFRAFLQERRAVGARGRNWLFFGDQRRECDFLYQEELEEYLQSGLLTRLDLAFSRDQAEKIYVQRRMQENAGHIWAWLEEGAHFYVCGDARRMARDVDETLHRIVAEQGHLSEESAREYVTALKRAKRYQRDVY